MSGIKNLKLIALDSNIFIYNLEQNSQYISSTDEIFNRLGLNKLKAVTSIISLTEILSYPKTDSVVKQITEDFYNTPNLKIIEVGQEVAVEAAEIRRDYGFKLPDAVQLATAVFVKAKAFVTNDHRLKSFKKLKIISLLDLA
ncbi:MAG: PIN domain-containing protein [Candidatus Daviesbacteria bacterium]|nr:PIN domain-containing protein [Candidatus Daviesbacteria bacterium]